MPPQADKKKPTFPQWDEYVQEAKVDLPDYELPLPPEDDETEPYVIKIPVPNGDQYLTILDGRRMGDAALIMDGLFFGQDPRVVGRLRRAMRGADFRIADVISGRALRYFYGLSMEREEQSGNSLAS